MNSDAPRNTTQPPTLQEVMAIVNRRRRRQRTVQRIAVIGIAAGTAVGVSQLATPQAEQIEVGQPSRPTTTPVTTPIETSQDNTTIPDTTLPAPETSGTNPECHTGRPPAFDTLWTTGTNTYEIEPTLDTAQITSLSDAYGAPTHEITTIAGIAALQANQLTGETFQRGIDAWINTGRPWDELTSMAEDWNVSTASLKALHELEVIDLAHSPTSCP